MKLGRMFDDLDPKLFLICQVADDFYYYYILMTTCEPFHLSHVVQSECLTENEFVAIRSQAHTAGPRMLKNSFTKWLLKNSGN